MSDSGLKVKDLPLDDRPREKLILRGAASLSDAELLAIILRTGTKGKNVINLAREMISKNENLGMLATKSVSALNKFEGVGKDKAATLAAVFEIARRVETQQKYIKEKQITSPEDVASIFIPRLRDEVKEHFIVVCLNSANRIIKYEVISVGSLSSSVVHPREVFHVAIDNNSANIILVHNHPSGNTEPSSADINITRRLVDAGKILDINIFDHIIIAGNSFTSFSEKRLL